MKRTIPKFEPEADEAKWWDEHLDELEDEMVEVLTHRNAEVLTRQRLAERVEQAKGRVSIKLA